VSVIVYTLLRVCVWLLDGGDMVDVSLHGVPPLTNTHLLIIFTVCMDGTCKQTINQTHRWCVNQRDLSLHYLAHANPELFTVRDACCSCWGGDELIVVSYASTEYDFVWGHISLLTFWTRVQWTEEHFIAQMLLFYCSGDLIVFHLNIKHTLKWVNMCHYTV